MNGSKDTAYTVQDVRNLNDFLLAKTVLLNIGYEMPILGLGTWTQDDDTAE